MLVSQGTASVQRTAGIVGLGPWRTLAGLAVGIDHDIPARLVLLARSAGTMPEIHAYSDAIVSVARIPPETAAAGSAL